MRNRDLPPLKPIGFAMAAVVAGLAPAEAQAAPVARTSEPARASVKESVSAPVTAKGEKVVSLKSAPVPVMSSPSEWAQGDLFSAGAR